MKKAASVFAFLLLFSPPAGAQESETPTVVESTPVETAHETTPTQPTPTIVEEPTPVEEAPVVENTPQATQPTRVIPPPPETPATAPAQQQTQTLVTEEPDVPSVTQQLERVSSPTSPSATSSTSYPAEKKPDSRDKPIRKQMALVCALFFTFLTILLWVGIYNLYKARKANKEREDDIALSDVVDYDPDRDFAPRTGDFYSAEGEYPETEVISTTHSGSWLEDDTQEIPVVKAELPPRRRRSLKD